MSVKVRSHKLMRACMLTAAVALCVACAMTKLCHVEGMSMTRSGVRSCRHASESRLEMKQMYADALDTIDVSDDRICVNGHATHCTAEAFYFRKELWSRRLNDASGMHTYDRLPDTLHGTALTPFMALLSATTGVAYARYVHPHSKTCRTTRSHLVRETNTIRITVPPNMFFALSVNPAGRDSRLYGFIEKERLYAWCWLHFRKGCLMWWCVMAGLAGCTRTPEESVTEDQEAIRLAHTAGAATRTSSLHAAPATVARRVHNGDTIMTQVAAFAALLGRGDADTRHPAWNAYNNPGMLGPLGCWYFSETYQTMTNAVLSAAGIAAVIRAAPAPQDLLWLGQQLFDGDMMVRDVHAARALYTHVSETVPDEDTRMYALRFLAETWSSALTADRDYARAVPLYQHLFEQLLERGDAAVNIDANINLHWALYGPMECYHQLGMHEQKTALIAAYTTRAPDQLSKAGAVAFGGVLIMHHHPPKDAAGLRAIADEYERVAREYYGGDASHSMVQKCRLFSGYFRELAERVALQVR